MMKVHNRKKSFTIVEIIISLLLVGIGTGMFASAYVSITKLIQGLHYRNTAINLLRDVVEFGETDFVLDECSFVYDFDGAAYTSECTTCPPQSLCSTTVETGCCADPFSLLGDIKARGLVPPEDPDTVIMHFQGTQYRQMPDTCYLPSTDPACPNTCDGPCNCVAWPCKEYYAINADIQWTYKGEVYSEELRVVPLGFVMSEGLAFQLGEFTETTP